MLNNISIHLFILSRPDSNLGLVLYIKPPPPPRL